MNDPCEALLDRYFDDELTETELRSLQEWLQQDSQNLARFVEASLLHNQLHGSIRAHQALQIPSNSQPDLSPQLRTPPSALPSRRILAASLVAAATILMLLFWKDSDTAQAGQVELRKVIAASAQKISRSYRIDVESNAVGAARQRAKPKDEPRPPKPPLDNARLFVRGGSQFVLQRQTIEGRTFITGSDGTNSWMVPPDGPVRVSRDLQRFNRDVPGHEFSMSLCNLSDALERLQQAYDLNALPEEPNDAPDVVLGASPDTAREPTRLLVATKKRGYPGPRRVEITYQTISGQIEQLRFIDMPYGPDRLTVRLTLDNTNLSAELNADSTANDFFEHAAHHASTRQVEQE